MALARFGPRGVRQATEKHFSGDPTTVQSNVSMLDQVYVAAAAFYPMPPTYLEAKKESGQPVEEKMVGLPEGLRSAVSSAWLGLGLELGLGSGMG